MSFGIGRFIKSAWDGAKGTLTRNLLPSVDATYALGTSALRWILDSAVLKGTLTASGTVTFPALTLGGKLTAGSSEIEGSVFDIDGGTIDGVTITAPALQGTVTAGTGLTMPAFIAGGDITIGANKINATGSLFKESGAGFTIRNLADNEPYSLVVNAINASVFQAVSDDSYFYAKNADAAYVVLLARDTGVGQVEVARMVGAADPYFRIGRDDTGVALNAVTDMLVLQAGGGTGNAAANFGFGLPVQLSNASSEQEERASIDFVLTDATNASEDVEINFKLQIAGAAPAEVLSIVGTGMDLPTGKVLSVAGTQVVGARVVDERADDAVDSTYGAEEAGVLDALRDAMIAHGLIAAA